MIKKILAFACLAVFAFACSKDAQTGAEEGAEGMVEETMEDAANSMEEAAADAKDAMEDAANSMEDAAADAKDAMEEAANSMEEAVDPLANVPATKLNGYFVRNDVDLKENTTFRIFKNQKDFDKYFGVAKTMDNVITSVDFKNESVVAILSGKSDMDKQINIKKVDIDGETMNVDYSVNVGEKQSYVTAPVYLFSVPMDKGLKSVVFNSGEKKTAIQL